MECIFGYWKDEEELLKTIKKIGGGSIIQCFFRSFPAGG